MVYENLMYFNSTQNYTLALLDAFNGIQSYYFNKNNSEAAYTVPISFGNYEKSKVMQDLSEEQIKKLGVNYLPRLVLGFSGMSKATERQTQKYQKFSKTLDLNDKARINFAYNSVAYDFKFTLLLQTRGLTQAAQITETILAKFNPTLNLCIDEFPLLGTTETQIHITDPEFDIPTDFDETDVNIINVSFDISIRGNIYQNIGLSGLLEEVNIYLNIWGKKHLKDANLAAHWKIDKTGTTKRTYDGTGRGTLPPRPEPELHYPESELIKVREDFVPHEEHDKNFKIPVKPIPVK